MLALSSMRIVNRGRPWGGESGSIQVGFRSTTSITVTAVAIGRIRFGLPNGDRPPAAGSVQQDPGVDRPQVAFLRRQTHRNGVHCLFVPLDRINAGSADRRTAPQDAAALVA